MVGGGYFTCKGEKHHILHYDIPDGMSAEEFCRAATCTECGEKIDFIPDNV